MNKVNQPRLAIIAPKNICCPFAHYANSLEEFLSPFFNVTILDLKTSDLLRKEGEYFQQASSSYIQSLCSQLKDFDVVNIHLELGIYGISIEAITDRIIELCKHSGRLIFTIHTLDYKSRSADHSAAYKRIISSLKNRPRSNPFHVIVHTPGEVDLIREIFGIDDVVDFPLIYLSDAKRKQFIENKNPVDWKKQFGLVEDDITIGVFGLMSAHKNYIHALQTIKILPHHYKLIVVGEAHHMNIQPWKVDPVIEQIVAFLDKNSDVAERVFFVGKRDDSKFFEDMTNVDFILMPSFEVEQTGSATLSNAMELSCAVLKSNTENTRQYSKYFSDCYEVFDIGNYYETKNKILFFDRSKIENLKICIQNYTEKQLRNIYWSIFEKMMKVPSDPLESISSKDLTLGISHSQKYVRLKSLYRFLPIPYKSFVTKIIKSALSKFS